MENNITTTPAAEGKKQQNAERNPLARFLTAVNKKRKQLVTSITTMVTMAMVTAVTAFADDTSGGGGGTMSNAGEEQFNQLINFFATWIGRIGLVVAFVGAIMFGLAVKNEDAEAKTRGLMTMVSGIIVFAVTKSLNLFGFDTGIV